MILKADHAVRVRHQVLLTKLHRRVRLVARARIDQANRLHRPIAQGVNAAARKFFDGQTRFEPARLFETLERDAVRSNQRLMEARVLVSIQWTIQVTVAALTITRSAKGN